MSDETIDGEVSEVQTKKKPHIREGCEAFMRANTIKLLHDILFQEGLYNHLG